jgi:pyruvate dehydrogenase E1 component beta subunit
MRGLRPLVDLNRASFMLYAMDQICNQAAKIHYLSAGEFAVPLTIACAMRGDYHVDVAREHAPYAMFANVPGLTVVVPGSIMDARRLLRASMRYNGPVVFFTSPLLAGEEAAAADQAELPLGRARVVQAGSDVTVVAVGAAQLVARQALEPLLGDGISVELIDPLTLSPLDIGTIRESVRKTRAVVLVDEASGDSQVIAGMAAQLTSDPATFARLLAPPQFVAGLKVPMPAALGLERAVLPTSAKVEQAVREVAGAVAGQRRGTS